MNFFERECIRNQVNEDEKKIQVLRLFVEDNAKEWYSANMAKLTLDSEWEDWKRSFIETYADKSWKFVHYAYSYKWINGSWLDYALKKENLLLETEPRMSVCSRINHIVIGLPIYIQDKLDKEEISTTEKLMNQLRRYSQAPTKGPKSEKQEMKKSPKISKTEERKPCKICELQGKYNRYHPTELCWNKSSNYERKNVNAVELEIEKEETKNE